MVSKVISSPAVATPDDHYTQAMLVEAPSRLLFISGMTARDNLEGGPTGSVAGVGDITVQAHTVYRKLKDVVEEAGGSLDDVVRVDVYVKDMKDFEAVHAVRQQYFTKLPTSTFIEVSGFVNSQYLIEISAIAALPAQKTD